MKNKIGFIGLGNMGLPIAQNLIKAGYHLQVYNRTTEKANALPQDFITICKTPAEASAGVPFVVSMVSDDDTLTELTSGRDGVLKTLPHGAVHISMSTVSPAAAGALSALHEAAGNHYIAAPVFGRPEAAAAKKLFVCTSGKAGAKTAAQPLLEAIGQGVYDFGEAAGAANVLKITGNFMILASLEMMAEAYTMAERSGLDPVQVAGFFGSTIFGAPIFQNYGKIIASKNFHPVGFKTKLGLKDARLALNLSKTTKTSTPLAILTHERLFKAVNNQLANNDWAEAFVRGVSEEKVE